MKYRKIKILKNKTVFNGRYIRVINRSFIDIFGKRGTWETVERKTYGRIVAVLPITKKGEVLLVKQYRIPVKKYVIELCAGLSDRKGENEKMVARRELLEETGYSVKRLEPLVHGPFAAGLLSDEMIIFVGTDAKKVQAPTPDSGESIEVVKVPLHKLERYLTHPPPRTKVDIKMFGVLYYLHKQGKDDHINCVNHV